jgi:hypothetical protein
MRYKPKDVKWEVLPPARAVHKRLHEHLPSHIEAQSRAGLRQLLCEYFSAGPMCDKKANGISPMGAIHSGGRAFKVRWKVPGRGKSGGLRLAVVAFCPKKHIVIAHAWARDTDPSDEEFAQGLQGVRRDT